MKITKETFCIGLGMLIGVMIGFVVCNWAWDVILQAKGVVFK